MPATSRQSATHTGKVSAKVLPPGREVIIRRGIGTALSRMAMMAIHGIVSVTFGLGLGQTRGQEPAVAPVESAAEANDDAGITFFEKEVRPLLVQHCYSCHAEGAKEIGGELRLDSRKGWTRGGVTGPAIIPGDVDASLLIRAVRHQDDDLQMPPVKPLEPADVAKLERWVAIGAPAPDKVFATRLANPADPVAGKTHWAFRPLMPVTTPVVTDTQWPTSEIDAFVLARLESEGLRPAGDAPRGVLARRVSIQLTGLPPSPDELRAFLDDDSPLAYERLVDRLIASPRFGERWGRHWLDLARYADSNGLDENFLFREAWRYRNWVIAAIGDDTPFDEFLRLQLAGDLLPHDSIATRDRQRIATGFLTLGPKVLLGNNPNNQRMEIADEQIDTVGRAVLGQSLGCARCHDHKFDPFPTADYYALAGIFASTRVMEQRYMLGEQRVMEQLIGLGESGGELDDRYETYWRDRPRLKEQKDRSEAALELIKKNDEAGLKAIIEKHADAVAEGAKEGCKSAEERVAAQTELVQQLTKAWNEPPAIPPRGMIATDADEPKDEAVRLAGQFDKPGETIPRGFLQVLCEGDARLTDLKGSGRIELSDWLTDADRPSGQLAARVLANRIWQHLIGRGLVRTTDNFGRTGEPPSHPELLDHLAKRLIEHRWSIKHLVREIVLSRTFRLGSDRVEANVAHDPDNVLLWRAHRRKLDPESLRDAMLAAADGLDHAMAESTVGYLGDQATAVGANLVRRRTDFPYRSVYLPVIRNDLPEIFEIMDFTDPHLATGTRRNTTVPGQGLFMLNDEGVMEASTAAARRLIAEVPSGDVAARVRWLYARLLSAQPTAEEIGMIGFAAGQFAGRFHGEGGEAAELKSWSLVCQALFASSRFQLSE